MKIIKRKREVVPENMTTDLQILLPSPQARIDDRRGMVNVVKSWIVERDANRQTEKIAATRRLFAWKTVGDG